MNILLFVTCFLMILSMLTYARIDGFRYFLATQAQFERYMESLERSYTSQIARQWYDTTIAKQDGAPSTRTSAAQASPRLSIQILFDKKMQANHSELHVQTIAWLKNLIHVLYGRDKYPFFTKALLARPTLVDEIIDALSRSVEALPDKMKPTQANELAGIALPPDLEGTFYLMLKGCSHLPSTADANVEGAPDAHSAMATSPDAALSSSQQDETEVAENAMEYFSDKGYDSLLNYITLKNVTKIRVYLASKPVLEAVFGSSDLADSIIEARENLYHAVMHGTSPEEATNQFQSMFGSYDKSTSGSFLDFKITKTNPVAYRGFHK